MFSVKHYLGCIALTLCVAGSAYANKNLGARTLTQQLKAGLQGKLAAIGNGELARKLANSKLARTAAAGVLGIGIACGGSGCGNDASLSPLTPEAEVVEVVEVMKVTEHYDGDNIYFEQGGIIYEGRVVEGVSADEVLVRLANGSEMVIAVDRIGGTLIAAHPDLETRVVMLGEREGERTLIGKIAGVYTDDVRKINISTVTFVDGTIEKLDQPRIRLVHKNKDFEDGGYLTREEFKELLKKMNGW